MTAVGRVVGIQSVGHYAISFIQNSEDVIKHWIQILETGIICAQKIEGGDHQSMYILLHNFFGQSYCITCG